MCYGGYLPNQVPAVGTGFFFLMGLEFYCGVTLLEIDYQKITFHDAEEAWYSGQVGLAHCLSALTLI